MAFSATGKPLKRLCSLVPFCHDHSAQTLELSRPACLLRPVRTHENGNGKAGWFEISSKRSPRGVHSLLESTVFRLRSALQRGTIPKKFPQAST
jgi:hypothetical protein